MSTPSTLTPKPIVSNPEAPGRSSRSLVALAALAAFVLSAVACDSSEAPVPGAPADASTDVSTDDSSTGTDPSGDAGDGGAPPPDGGNDADAHQPIAKHCPTGVQTNQGLCLETAEGHAGETVSLEVHASGTTSCPDAFQLYGRIIFDPTYFALANEADQVDCRSRGQIPGADAGTEEITWQAFGGGAIANCDDAIPSGKVDTIELSILAGTPPGDYTLAWEDTFIQGTTAPCDVSGPPSMPGIVRVLP